MKAVPFFLVSTLLSVVPVPAMATILLNEIYANPPGSDDAREYVEIISTSGDDSLDGVWLLEIESDKVLSGAVGAERGQIDNAVDLSGATFGPNGLLVLGPGYDQPGTNPWELTTDDVGLADLARTTTIDNEHVMLLVTGFTGTEQDDIDADDNNVFDTVPWDMVLDGVAFVDPDGDAGLAGSPTNPRSYDYLGVFPLEVGSSSTVDALARIPGNTTALSTDAWYGGEIDDFVSGDLSFIDIPEELTGNFPDGGILTPGAPNEPALRTVPGDFNGDGNVDGDDFLVWQQNFPAGDGADADGDSDSDGDDFLIWQQNFGGSSGIAGAAVPEPTAVSLVILGSLVVMMRRSNDRRRRVG